MTIPKMEPSLKLTKIQVLGPRQGLASVIKQRNQFFRNLCPILIQSVGQGVWPRCARTGIWIRQHSEGHFPNLAPLNSRTSMIKELAPPSAYTKLRDWKSRDWKFILSRSLPRVYRVIFQGFIVAMTKYKLYEATTGHLSQIRLISDHETDERLDYLTLSLAPKVNHISFCPKRLKVNKATNHGSSHRLNHQVEFCDISHISNAKVSAKSLWPQKVPDKTVVVVKVAD